MEQCFTITITNYFIIDLFLKGIKIPHRYDEIPPTTDVRVNLQQYPPMHIKYNPAKAQPHQQDHTDITDDAVPADKVIENKNRLLFSSAEMFKKPLWQTVRTQIKLLL